MSRTELFITALLLGSIGTSNAQEDVLVTPLFADDTPLELTIEGPFRRLSQRNEEIVEACRGQANLSGDTQ